MSLFDNIENLKSLQKLLTIVDNSDSDTDDGPPTVRRGPTPATIGAVAPTEPGAPAEVKEPLPPVVEEPKQPSTVEEWQEMQEKEDADLLETRERPAFIITYRQAVGTEDLFLQMGNRTNSTVSCEEMLMDILLPGETVEAEKMNLTLTDTDVDFSTPMYRLKMPLPHTIDVDASRAKYDKDLQKMCLVLRLKREFDFVNF